MGKGKKRGKKAKSREAHDAKKAREAEQYRLQNERGERITEYIRRFLHEMCAYSEACFQFALKNHALYGRGCVHWFIPSLEVAADPEMFKTTQLVYFPVSQARSFEYAPIMQHLRDYKPLTSFVAHVAIRTGDERDSLMNVMSIGQHGHTQVAAQDLPRMNFPSIKLGFTGSGGEHAVVTPGLRLCSYAECHEVEPEPGAFPACGGCESAWYHDRTCQAKDWKLKVAPTFAHKLTCPHLKQLKMIRQMQLSQQNPHDPDSQQQLLAMLRKMQLEAGAKGGKATSKVSGDGDGDGASSPSAGASAGAGTGAGGGAGAGGSTPVPSTAAAAASDAGTA